MRHGNRGGTVATAIVGFLAGGLFVSVGVTVVPGGPVSVERNVVDGPPWRESVVRVRSLGCGDVRTGIGAVVDGRLTTNRHVVDGARAIEVETVDGTTLAVTSVAAAAGIDLAELKIANWLPGLELASTDRTVGDVLVGGFGSDGAFRTQRGRLLGSLVASANTDPPRPIRLGLQVVPGQSGSPVVGTDGRVVGVVYARADADGSGLVIPASDIARWALRTRTVPFAVCE